MCQVSFSTLKYNKLRLLFFNWTFWFDINNWHTCCYLTSFICIFVILLSFGLSLQQLTSIGLGTSTVLCLIY
uniref:Uncharacterized protein n=1 Tax=Arundo donax TaxID=35708 RepID=A0A0A8YVI3_ARUDO